MWGKLSMGTPQGSDPSTYFDNAINYRKGVRHKAIHSPECPSIELPAAGVCSCNTVLNKDTASHFSTQDKREKPYPHPTSYLYSPPPSKFML